MDAGVLPFGNAGQAQNSFPQFLMKFVSRFHAFGGKLL
jgi:hypothetical protein